MKMEKYLLVLVGRLNSWLNTEDSREIWKNYCEIVKKDTRVHNLQVRLAWDASRLVTTAEERSEWIHDCNGNDATFTTLAIAAAKEVGMV